MCTVVTAQGACHAPSARRALRGRCAVGRRVRGWSSPLTGASRTGLGWHWQDNAQLAAGPGAGRARAFARRLSFSSAREALRGPGHSKAACACPGTSRLGHVGGLAGYHDGGPVDLAGGSVPPAVPAMQGPLPGRAAAAGRPGAARPLALRPRPGEPRLPVEHGPTGAQTHQGPRGARSNLNLDSRIGNGGRCPVPGRQEQKLSSSQCKAPHRGRGLPWRKVASVRLLPRRRVSGKPLRVASPSFVPARTSLQARRLQAFLQDGANVARWLAYKDSYCPSNLSWRIAHLFEPPFGLTTAFSRSPLLRSAWRGMRRAVCRVCPDPPDPFLVGHSGVL